MIFLKKIIEYILEEDEGFGDITSNAVIDKQALAIAQIISKDDGILAGIEIIKDLLVSKNIEIISSLNDGDKISKGDLLLEVKGNARTILLLERTLLNVLMRMSGVATAAYKTVELVRDYDVRIAGTRKTSPAIAKLDKLALRIGGADTHRFTLDDMILIKDNHIALVGSPLDALKLAQANSSFSKKIEIEVETLEDAIQCIQAKADIVMLDNMGIDEVKNVLAELDKLNIRNNSLIEISGGITPENVVDYAKLGVDIISLGDFTHSTSSLNFSLNINKF